MYSVLVRERGPDLAVFCKARRVRNVIGRHAIGKFTHRLPSGAADLPRRGAWGSRDADGDRVRQGLLGHGLRTAGSHGSWLVTGLVVIFGTVVGTLERPGAGTQAGGAAGVSRDDHRTSWVLGFCRRPVGHSQAHSGQLDYRGPAERFPVGVVRFGCEVRAGVGHGDGGLEARARR
jgi:hypothetical protein